MTKKVESIKKNSNSSMDWSVIETLRALANEIESGEAEYNKCFICLLNHEVDKEYTTGFRSSKLYHSEAIALVEISKNDLLQQIRESNW